MTSALTSPVTSAVTSVSRPGRLPSVPALAFVLTVTAAATVAVTLGPLLSWRYADWSYTDRFASEVLIVVLPVVSATLVPIAVKALRPTHLWLLPSLTRAATGILISTGLLLLAVLGGYLVGMAPVLVWSAWTATGEGPSIPALLAGPLWLMAVSAATIVAVCVRPTMMLLFPAVGVWVGLYFLSISRIGVDQNPLAVLPFSVAFPDGFPGQLVWNPRLDFVRCVVALMILSCALLLLRSMASWPPAERAKLTLTSPLLLGPAAVLAVLVIGGPSPLVSSRAQHAVVCADGPVRTCVRAEHRRDLAEAHVQVQAVTSAAGPALASFDLATETPARNSDGAVVRIGGLSPRLPVFVAGVVATQLVNMDGCLRTRQYPGEVLAAWLVTIAGYPPAPGSAPDVPLSWIDRPDQVRASLTRNPSLVENCLLKLDMLPR